MGFRELEASLGYIVWPDLKQTNKQRMNERMNEWEEKSESGLIVTIFLKIHGILCPRIELKKREKEKFLKDV